MGAAATIDGNDSERVAEQVADLTKGGAHVSIDALGSPRTCANSIACLRKRGKHVQIGLMLADNRNSAVPLDKIIANELVILGSHGMQAHRYPEMLSMIRAAKLMPEKLIGRTISLEDALAALPKLDMLPGTGVTVIDTF
jgi:alcohol dehydrogenase